MNTLDLRVPPMIVVVLLGAAMWGLARLAPALHLAYPGRLPLAVAIGLLGLAAVIAALVQFKRHQTTPDPTRPDKSTAIVTTGIYGRTRNPMYLGMLLWLIAWAVYLANGAAAIVPAVFVLYMHHFQILPEERALTDKFGTPYEQYLRTVRRWL